MRYNDNLAAFIPQHVARRKPVSRKGNKRGLAQERQIPKRRPIKEPAYLSSFGEPAPLAVETGNPENVRASVGAARSAAAVGIRSFVREKTGLELLSLKSLLIVLVTAVVSIFAYNALLWQRNYNELKPAPEERAGEELLTYANPIIAVQVPAEGSEEIPLPLSDSFSWTEYKVQKGDSISKIAAVYGLSLDAVIASNSISRARALREGEILRIPNMDGIPVTVKKGDTLSKLSANFDVPVNAILDANDLVSETLSSGMTLFLPGAKMKGEELRSVIGDLFIYPVRGRLSSQFGWRSDPISGERKYHAAIDLAANQGTPVKAAMEGKVTSVGFNSTYGNYIIITHSGGYQTMYAHLASTGVQNGQSVAQGKEIGKVGSTGYSTGPHLHFAIYKNSRALNPLEYLKF